MKAAAPVRSYTHASAGFDLLQAAVHKDKLRDHDFSAQWLSTERCGRSCGGKQKETKQSIHVSEPNFVTAAQARFIV
jgi:hypothetical protein